MLPTGSIGEIVVKGPVVTPAYDYNEEETRMAKIPDVPTAKELGYDVEMATWRGVGVKAGTPPEVVKVLRDAFQESMKHKIYQSYLADNSMGPESVLTGEEWDAFLDEKWPIWKETMDELGYIEK